MDTTNHGLVPSSPDHLEPTVERHRFDPSTLPHMPLKDSSPEKNSSGRPLGPTVDKSQLGPGQSSQRVYNNIISGGHSRNVYGDIYNTYHVHPQDSTDRPVHSSADSKKAEDDAAKSLMDVLVFDDMDTRRATISDAHAQTCQWLFAREDYASWRDREALRKHYGFFWIKGKPGAGKSTLMKCAQQYGEERHKDLIVSFFFNARGGELQSSAEGMYRSLLHQLLKMVPALTSTLGAKGSRTAGQSWPVSLLDSMLKDAICALGRLGRKTVTCYIDALDECNEEEARSVIESLEALARLTIGAHMELRVLLSSRHYPHIFINDCLELHLDTQADHERDIVEYIRCKLKVGKSRLALEIQGQIQARASGVFLWVVLVIRILNEYNARGKTHLLRDRLATIPSGLSELFKEILQRGKHDPDDTLLTFLWILFAHRPLRREELYFAVVTNSSDDAIGNWDANETTLDVMDKYLLDTSKGLAEITKGTPPTVQFVHESVKDYLLDEGLAAIQPGLREDLATFSHERLKDCCIHYLENSGAALLPTPYIGVKGNIRTELFWNRMHATHPFLLHAVYGVVYHANLTHSLSRSQAEFVAGFPHRFWRRCYNLCSNYSNPPLGVETQSLYTFVLMKAHKLAMIDIERLSGNVENQLKGESHETLLAAAISQGDTSMMKLLMDHGADPNDVSRPNTSSCLSLAIKRKDLTMVRTLLEHGAGPTCLVFSPGDHESTSVESLRYALERGHCDQEVIECILSNAPYSLMTLWSEVLTDTLFITRYRGYHSIERSLLERMEVLVNNFIYSKASAASEDLGEVFVAACGHGDLTIVKVLIKHNILQASDKIAKAFAAAVHNRCAEVIRILLSNGVAIDLKLDDVGSTALVIASRRGHVDIVRLLLDHDGRDARWSIALHSATMKGQAATVKMLLDAGADPNTHGEYPEIEIAFRHESQWGTPLHMATRYGFVETARVLLDHASTDPDALDWWGDHAICVATERGHSYCVELLLKRNIPIEDLDSAAVIAAEEGYPDIMDMLLAEGATPPSDYERPRDSSSSNSGSSADSFSPNE